MSAQVESGPGKPAKAGQVLRWPACASGVDRFTLGIAVGAVALVSVLFVMVLVLPRDAGPMDEAQPAGVVHNYFLALQNDDPKTAYGYLSADSQARLSYERFAAQRRTELASKRVRLDEERIEGDTARVTVRWTRSSEGPFPFTAGEYSSAQTLVLRLENGAWKLTQAPYTLW